MREVIDSHTHTGAWAQWNCDAGSLLSLMDRAGVALAVTGDPAANDAGAKALPAAVRKIRPFSDRLRLMLWVNPRADDLQAAEALLETDRDLFACVKVHPRTAGIPLGDERYLPYLDLCRRYCLPFVSHTEHDGYADIGRLAVMAEENPGTAFIAVHMELRSDHRHSIDLIAAHENLYGDTTFVPPEDVLTAISRCGAEKILFGTDAPVTGEHSYDSLPVLERVLTEQFSPDAAHAVLRGNCERLMLQKYSGT
ncbi:MAG: hypothetical protein CW338_04945 [Clostridiales bacterium]|nr:hypothetical protein [Clostridiales bacterium]